MAILCGFLELGQPLSRNQVFEIFRGEPPHPLRNKPRPFTKQENVSAVDRVGELELAELFLR